MKKLLLTLAMAVFLMAAVGCSSGSDPLSPPPPTVTEPEPTPEPEPEPPPLTPLSLELLLGKYKLLGFHVWDNAGTDFNETDMTTWSGLMRIYASGAMSQTIVLNGQASSALAKIEEVQDDASPGQAGRMEITSAGCTYWIQIYYKEQERTLETLFMKGTCGLPFYERDLWQKINSNPMAILNDEKTDIEPSGNVGSGAGQLWDELP